MSVSYQKEVLDIDRREVPAEIDGTSLQLKAEFSFQRSDEYLLLAKDMTSTDEPPTLHEVIERQRDGFYREGSSAISSLNYSPSSDGTSAPLPPHETEPSISGEQDPTLQTLKQEISALFLQNLEALDEQGNLTSRVVVRYTVPDGSRPLGEGEFPAVVFNFTASLNPYSRPSTMKISFIPHNETIERRYSGTVELSFIPSQPQENGDFEAVDIQWNRYEAATQEVLEDVKSYLEFSLQAIESGTFDGERRHRH